MATERTDLRLVELVQPHEELYNGKCVNSQVMMDRRAELWTQITITMNNEFNLCRTLDEYKTRWLALRSNYRQGLLKKNVQRKTIVIDQMGFLRPFTNVSVTTYKKKSKKPQKMFKHNLRPANSNYIITKPQPPSQIKTRQFNNGGIKHNYDSDLVTYSNIHHTVKREPIEEPTDDAFEIIVPDEDTTAPSFNDEEEEDTLAGEKHYTRDMFDEDLEDSDGAFGLLVTRELREMSPSSKREFKRTVTQLLYS